MTYYQNDRIIDQYAIEAQHNNEINDTWGPEADVAVSNKAGTSLISTETKQKAANAYVGYKYFDHLGMKERADAELAKFDKFFADYLESLTGPETVGHMVKTIGNANIIG